jgi:hypothetical protein
MQAAEWITIFKKMPEEYQELLMLSTNNGTEFAVQQFLRMDETFILVRGRLGGTTDANRIFVIPYDYLSFAYFNRPVSDERLAHVFGELLQSTAGERRHTVGESPPAEGDETTPAELAPELPQIDTATLQPQLRPAAAAPRSVAASLRERLLRSRGGPRQ